MMTDIDALCEQNYALYDPQNVSERAIEQADMNDAIDEIISALDTVRIELQTVKENFTTRRFNNIIDQIEELTEELKGMRTEDE